VFGFVKGNTKIRCKPISNPIDRKVKLNAEDSELLKDVSQF
jgi:hypothetical protein